MSNNQRSSIAQQIIGMRDPALGSIRQPWGLLVHTTGGGITDLARRKHEKPLDVALKVYLNSQNGSNGYFWGGPTYLCDLDGKLHQIAPDDIMTAHCGGSYRAAYLDGSWTHQCPLAAVNQWHAKWPMSKHPYALFPSTSPNKDYVGVEMIPIGDGFGGPPMAAGLRFSKAQHDAIVMLAHDVAKRHDWPKDWHRTSRLLGHEDVDPINRSDKEGGWDPGNLRARPYFDFPYVRSRLDNG